MAYDSVDKMQTALADSVFTYAKDRKKAAGRCLGTFIEIVTFYLLKSWGVAPSVGIERGLAEYNNPAITHNVEYSLHPVSSIDIQKITDAVLPLTTAKIFRQFGDGHHLHGFKPKPQVLLTKEKILRNACVIGETDDKLLIGLVSMLEGKGQAELHALGHGGTIGSLELDLVAQYRQPYAMFECKRVGVEDGMKKGPQTIEKAKQGAYVARTVSSMQRIRTHDGSVHGVLPMEDGTLYSKPYDVMMAEIIASDNNELLRNFILTVGVVSNHGNWFTKETMNKELVVLAQSYDWLLFLTDDGLSEFISDTWNVGGIDAGSIVGNANNGGKTWTVDWQSGLNDIKSGSGAGSLFVLSDPTASLYLTHNWWKQQKCCPNGSSGNLNKIWETGNANYALSGNFDYTAISVFPSWYQDIINYLGSLPGYSNQLATITGFGHFKAGTGASVNANTTIYTLMEDDCNGCSASYTTGDCQFNANMNDSATSTLFGGVNISITGSFSSDLRTYGVAVPPAPATQMNIYMQDYITYSLYSYAKIGSHGPGGYYWITPGSQHMPNPATVINTVCITPNL